MLFNSYPFALFFCIVFLLYYLPFTSRFQVTIIVASSFIFYAYDQPYLLLLLMASAVNSAISSYLIARSNDRKFNLFVAAAGLVINVSFLFFFKYSKLVYDVFGLDALLSGNDLIKALITLPLPIGISFYTFHGISLVVDVLRSKERQVVVDTSSGFRSHLQNTLLYLTFFPQLIAGPITKANFFYPQIVPKKFADIHWSHAAKALITGFFLKMVIADNLQDTTFWLKYPYFMHSSSVELLAWMWGYSMQIFADFAGYSLIAIGLATLLGYTLPVNFNFPYISQSFSEFWRRWHITLSTWLRDYLYIPLGGNRKGMSRTYFNLMLVMFLGGLWHGAALSYAAWGSIHGIALAIERIFKDSRYYTSRSKLLTVTRWAVTFTTVTFAWLMFRLTNIHEVWLYVTQIASNIFYRPAPVIVIAICIYSLPVVFYHLLYLTQKKYPDSIGKLSPVIYGAMLAAIVLNRGESNGFIYFQF